MEILLLLLLLIVATALYLPEILKERTLDSPLDTISDFHRGMNALALSTHNMDHTAGERPGYYYAGQDSYQQEPYVRRSRYADHEEDFEDEITPYPMNRARYEMRTRRHRIIAVLLILELTSGILSLLPSFSWMLPVTVALIVISAGYIFLAVLLPGRERPR